MIALWDLEGDWVLQRQIEDRKAGMNGRFEGRSVWRRDGDGLRQEETGVLHYGTAPPMQATRRYLWRPDGDGIAVLFDDGRPFHRLGAGRLTDRHLCAPDIYVVAYDLSAWPDWTQVWHVTGPRKDSVLTSRFTRAG